MLSSTARRWVSLTWSIGPILHWSVFETKSDAAEHEVATGELHSDQDEDGGDGEEDAAEGCELLEVAGLAEVVEQDGHGAGLGADQEDRRGELARGDDEDNEPAADEAAADEGRGDQADRAQAARSEDAGGLFHLGVDGAEGGVAVGERDGKEAGGEAQDDD